LKLFYEIRVQQLISTLLNPFWRGTKQLRHILHSASPGLDLFHLFNCKSKEFQCSFYRYWCKWVTNWPELPETGVWKIK